MRTLQKDCWCQRREGAGCTRRKSHTKQVRRQLRGLKDCRQGRRKTHVRDWAGLAMAGTASGVGGPKATHGRGKKDV